VKLSIDRIEEDPREHELGDWAKGPVGESVGGDVGSLEGWLEVRRVDESVFVQGEVHASVERSCDRCGALIIARLGGPMKLAYVPSERGGTISREVHGGEMEIGFYEEGVVDLADVLREHFALCIPDRLACDLAGVSLAPGAKCRAQLLAKEPEAKPVDPRFAALKGLKLD